MNRKNRTLMRLSLLCYFFFGVVTCAVIASPVERCFVLCWCLWVGCVIFGLVRYVVVVVMVRWCWVVGLCCCGLYCYRCLGLWLLDSVDS